MNKQEYITEIRRRCRFNTDLHSRENMEWKGEYTPTEFVCKFHGSYQDSPAHNLCWGGCQKCLQDDPKVKIGEILTKMNYWFETSAVLGNHRFDFALVEKSYGRQRVWATIQYLTENFYFWEKLEKRKIEELRRYYFCESLGIRFLKIQYTMLGKLEETSAQLRWF